MTALRPVRRARHLRAVPGVAATTDAQRLREQNAELRARVDELEAMLHGHDDEVRDWHQAPRLVREQDTSGFRVGTRWGGGSAS